MHDYLVLKGYQVEKVDVGVSICYHQLFQGSKWQGVCIFNLVGIP